MYLVFFLEEVNIAVSEFICENTTKNCFYSTLRMRCLNFYEIKLTVLNMVNNLYPSIIIFFLS